MTLDPDFYREGVLGFACEKKVSVPAEAGIQYGRRTIKTYWFPIPYQVRDKLTSGRSIGV
jgi:hypothetical protein